MNNPSHPQPRQWCRVVRGWSAIAGDPSSSGIVSRHVAHCAACQAYFAAASALEDRLRGAAVATSTRPLPAGFEQRLQRAINLGARPPARAHHGARWAWWSIAGGAVAAATVFAIVLTRSPEAPRNAPMVAHSEAATPSSSPATAAASRAIASAINENPLEREIDDVYADARAALQFLALNFLPRSATEPDAPPPT